MNKALAVARWEYMEKVKSKAFLIGLFLTPLLMVGMGVLPAFFATQEETESTTIGVADLSGDFLVPFAQRLQSRFLLSNGQPAYIVMPVVSGRGTDAEEAARRARELMQRGDIEGYLLFGPDLVADSSVVYRSRTVGDLLLPMRVEEVLRELIAERRTAALGIDPGVVNQLRVRLTVSVQKLSGTGEEEGGGFETVFFSSYAFLMMLLFLIATSGQMLVRSVLMEKMNRIVEVLVSSCSATELMAGKVIGLSALALTQMAVWVVVGVAVAAQFQIVIVDPGSAALLGVYFVLGYLLYAAVFIAAGSPLTTEQEAQQVTSYLILLLLLPIVLTIPAMKDPDAPWLTILSYVPLLTPAMMALRLPIQTPPAWEIVATIMVLVVSIYVAMVVAGRIFRIAILSTGKTPTLKEVLRWVRTG